MDRSEAVDYLQGVLSNSEGAAFTHPLSRAKVEALLRLLRRDNRAGLTERQTEAVRWLVFGLKPVEIAEKMGLSPATIRTHMAKVHAKWGTHSAAETVEYAITSGLVGRTDVHARWVKAA